MSFRRIQGVFYRYFHTAFKSTHVLSDLLYWPLIDIILWGLTSSWLQHHGQVENLPLILMTGLIFWQITWRGSVDVSVNLLEEFWHRNLVNLFSTPLKISEWCYGVLLLCLCKLVITVAFGALLVYFLYALNVFTIGWAFLPFAASLLIFGWTLGFLSSSAIIYFGHQVEAIAWMAAYLFAPFSAVFYPVDILPFWAQTISWALPTTYIFEGMRDALTTQTFPLLAFLISLGLNALYLTGALVLFKFSFEKSRIKGLARLE